jgi:hypothetical protein
MALGQATSLAERKRKRRKGLSIGSRGRCTKPKKRSMRETQRKRRNG